MKSRIIIASMLLLVANVQTAYAQKMIVRMAGNQIAEYSISQVEDVIFEENETLDENTHGITDGHEWVDLGLPSGTLWATCNIGANSPEEYGDYYAWGETRSYGEGKTTFDWSTYAYSNSSGSSMTKYCMGASYGAVDNKNELDPGDDAATAKWGNEWQMPSAIQQAELINNDYTQSKWISINGVYGRKITSKKNGNSIFLPAVGYRVNDGCSNVSSSGNYWARSLYPNNSYGAYALNIDNVNAKMGAYYRYLGYGLRPVCAQQRKLVTNIILNNEYLYLLTDETKHLIATIEPSDASNSILIWESSNPSVAKVNNGGLVTALTDGFCVITCRAADGSGVFAECSVIVGYTDSHGFVDLGLPSGTLWATCNVGAETPEEIGDYFAWGETQPKEDYVWETYKYCNNGNEDEITKYRTYSEEEMDNKSELEPEDDAATVNWGNHWQTPNSIQIDELISSANTTVEFKTQNGVSGLLITSNRNGKSIFFPEGGYRLDTRIIDKYNGYYWTSRSKNIYRNWFATTMTFGYSVLTKATMVAERYSRCYGMPIRPVHVYHEYVDLGLPSGTLWATCNVGANSPEEFGHYFAWGETQPKSSYTWDTYKFNKGYDEDNLKYIMTKYNCWYERDGQGNIILKFDKPELDPEDDAATVNWGSEWQMPSEEQMHELINSQYTSTEWTTVNSVKVKKIISKSNGNYILLPAAGRNSGLDENPLHLVGTTGYLWSRSLDRQFSTGAYYQNFDENVIGCSPNGSRFVGFPVRPVRK